MIDQSHNSPIHSEIFARTFDRRTIDDTDMKKDYPNEFAKDEVTLIHLPAERVCGTISLRLGYHSYNCSR